MLIPIGSVRLPKKRLSFTASEELGVALETIGNLEHRVDQSGKGSSPFLKSSDDIISRDPFKEIKLGDSRLPITKLGWGNARGVIGEHRFLIRRGGASRRLEIPQNTIIGLGFRI